MLQSQRSPYPKLSYDFSGTNAENFQFYDHHGSGRGFLYGRKYTTGTTPNSNAGWHFYGNDNTLGLRIDGSANVGVGTSTVDAPLHIFKAGGNAGDVGGGIKMERWDNYGCAIWSQYPSGGTVDCMAFRCVNNASDAYLSLIHI